MKKVSFRETEVDVEGKKQKIWVLETPTFLNRMLKRKLIDEETFEQKLKTYEDAIELKEKETKSNGILRNYQQQTVNYAKEFNSFAIFDEPRLGKTPTIISLLKEKDLLNEKIIVMSPSNVIGNWIKAFKTFGDKETSEFRGEFNENNILIMTRERSSTSLKELIKWNPLVVILDEAHILRNSRGKRQGVKYTAIQKEKKALVVKLQKEKKEGKVLTQEELDLIKNYEEPISTNKAILTIASKAKHRFPLSGTPGVNQSEDIFAILQFTYPQFYKSYWSFVYYFFEVKISHWGGREIKGIRNDEKEAELQETLNYLSTRNLQSEKMPWLIPAKQIVNYLPLSKYQKELEYDLLENGKLGEQFILNTLEQMTHHTTICLSPKISEYLDTNHLGSKIEYLLDYIMDNPLENIAIFSTRKEFIKVLEEEIRKEFPNKTVYTIKNNKQSMEIQSIINIKSKKHDIIFLGTIGKNKEGISLVGLNKAFLVDQPWIPSDVEQIIHRLDATTPEEQEYFGTKEFEILQHKDSIDTIIQEKLDEKLSNTATINRYKEFIEKRKKNG